VLIFFLDSSWFGLPLIIRRSGQPDRAHDLLFKLTNILGTPSYQLMASWSSPMAL